MNFYSLKSIIAASKTPISMSKPSVSFRVAEKPDFKYIEPEFTKEEFEIEKPAVILVSAAGATGKSALANVLSHELSIPLLDLSKHKPVGDNTLTGLVADSFDFDNLSKVLEGFKKGSFGIIIDGVDEGRAKVTEKAFDAFLDDIVQRCQGTTITSCVLLGRTNVLEDCCLYLADKGISTGLISIQPFDVKQAKNYIDTLTGGTDSSFASEYESTRDAILNLLSAAFHEKEGSKTQEFLPFIGYPPVLDAIATLLKGERDYHKLRQNITNVGSGSIEIDLLSKINGYILNRERDQKVHPNILNPIIKELPLERQKSIKENAYDVKEQCQRLVSHCLNKDLRMSTILEAALNDRYEEQLAEFIPDHPFVTRNCFRNAVFESFALAELMTSNDPSHVSLVTEYANSHKHSYHLVYFLNQFASESPMPDDYLHTVLEAAYEFRSSKMIVDVHVGSSQSAKRVISKPFTIEAEIEIEMLGDDGKEKQFRLLFEVNKEKLYLGRMLSSTYISLPIEVIIESPQEIELIAPVYIEAESINLFSNELIVRNPPKSSGENFVDLVAQTINSSLTNIKSFGAELHFIIPKKTGLAYPIFEYAVEASILTEDSEIPEKYLRLKRILVEFRSHNRGQLARFRGKIESPRVLRNEIGQAILTQLIKDNLITLKDVHYFLNTDRLGSILGISWQDLCAARTNDKLTTYLRAIHT